MDPLTIAGMAIGGLSSIFTAGAQRAQGLRQMRNELWLADQQRQASYKEASTVGQSAVDQALRSSRIYDIYADIARSNERIVGMGGAVEEHRSRDATERGIASQRAFFANAGIDPNSGSALYLAASGAAQGEMDAQIIRARTGQSVAEQGWNTFSAAQSGADAITAGLTTIDSAFDTASARAAGITSAATVRADNARMSGIYGAATTLLNTASQWGQRRDVLSAIGSGFSGMIR